MVPGSEDPRIDANRIPGFQEAMVSGTQGPRICEDLKIPGIQKYGMRRLMVSSFQALGGSRFQSFRLRLCHGFQMHRCEVFRMRELMDF